MVQTSYARSVAASYWREHSGYLQNIMDTLYVKNYFQTIYIMP